MIFAERGVLLDVVVWVAQSETLEPVLLLAQRDELVFRIITQRTLNRVACGFRYMNE